MSNKKKYFFATIILCLLAGLGLAYAIDWYRMFASSNFHSQNTGDLLQPHETTNVRDASEEQIVELIAKCMVDKIIFSDPNSSSALILIKDGGRAEIKSGSEAIFRAAIDKNGTKCGSVSIERNPYLTQ